MGNRSESALPVGQRSGGTGAPLAAESALHQLASIRARSAQRPQLPAASIRPSLRFWNETPNTQIQIGPVNRVWRTLYHLPSCPRGEFLRADPRS
jgi:hypothetical protein